VPVRRRDDRPRLGADGNGLHEVAGVEVDHRERAAGGIRDVGARRIRQQRHRARFAVDRNLAARVEGAVAPATANRLTLSVSVFTATTVWPSALTAIGPDLGAFPGAGAGGAVSVGVAVGTLVAVAVGATTTWLRSATQRSAGRRLLPSGHCGIGPRGDVRRRSQKKPLPPKQRSGTSHGPVAVVVDTHAVPTPLNGHRKPMTFGRTV
jgi:hypothetical protein